MNEKSHEFPVEKILSLLPKLTSLLEEDLRSVDPHFSQLGNNLQSVFAESSTLSEEITLFANNMAAGDEGSFKHDVGKIVDDSLTVLSDCRDTLSRNLENIGGSTGHLQELCAICEKVQKCAVFLNVVGLNISVEGCRTNEVLEMFGDFGEQIKELAKRIGEIAATISDNSEKARKDQVAVHKDITGGMKTFDELSLSAKDAVQHAMLELTTIGDLAASTLEKAGRHSQEISRAVGEIVISIQSHDILRQQIEHIVSAMADVCEILTSDSEVSDQTDDDTSKKGKTQSIIALQSAQMKHVVTELQDIYSKMQQDLKNIGNEVKLLIKNVAATHSEDAEISGLESKLQAFKAELEKLRELLARGDSLEEKIKITMETSSRAISTLSHHTAKVTTINIDLQYKALNAIIMTNKLGEKGATLEVLARSVRDLSAELDGLVKNVLDKINAITNLAETPGTDAAVAQDQTVTISDSVALLDQGITRITDAFEFYGQSVEASEKKAEELMASIETTGEGLDFLPGWIDGSQEVLEKLEDLLTDLSPWETAGKEFAAALNEDISQRYTMEKEREIHKQLTAADEQEQAEEPGEMQNFPGISDTEPTEAEDSAAEDADDLDDNIELF